MSRTLLGVACLLAASLAPPESNTFAADESCPGSAAKQSVAKPRVTKPGVHVRQAPDPNAGRDLRRAVKAALAQPLGADAEEQALQARALLGLFAQVKARDSLTTSECERLLTRLRGRLARLAKSLGHNLAREGASDSKDVAGPESVASLSHSSSASTSASESAQTPPPGAAGGAARSDAQDLIDLIQTTIAPSSWDVNGGPGSIVYWPLGQALVVRQTSEVHEDLGGVVGRLRK